MSVQLLEDDFPHTPGPDADWQESVVLIFMDRREGLTGFIRAGCEPNAGVTQLHLDFATQDGLRYRHHRSDQPMTTAARPLDGFAAEPLTWTLHGDGTIHLQAALADMELDFVMRNDFESTPWQLLGGGDMAILAPGHLESSGSIDGWLRIGERTFQVDAALAHRDHSWGRRDVRVMRSFRWVAGCCGPELAFSGAVVHLADGRFVRSAWLRRHGRPETVRDFDVVALVNADGVTTRGGHAVWTLESGECVQVEAEVLDGFITSYRTDHGGPGSHIGVEGMACARCGELQGFCDFNVSNNPAGGEQPTASVCEAWATLAPGLSHRPPRISMTGSPGADHALRR